MYEKIDNKNYNLIHFFCVLCQRFIVSVVSDMFIIVGRCCDSCAPRDITIITIILIIIANVEYFFGASLMNFSVPTDIAHMPKINARIKVNNTDLMPNIKPDNVVINAYTAIVVDW